MSKLFRGVLGCGVFAIAMAHGARPVHARCEDLGGIGVMFGAAGGFAATVVTGFVNPAIAVAVEPKLNYWPGVGYTLLAGTTATVASSAALASECPFPETLYVPTLVAVPTSILTTALWASLTNTGPKSTAVAVSLAPLRSRDGALLTLGGRF